MSAEDDFSRVAISEELLEELDVEAYAKKYRYLRFMCQETLDHLAFLKDKVKDVEGFWASTILKHVQLKQLITSKSDKDALKYLTQIELVQDPKDPRPFALKFHFKENPYFSDSVLEKKYELPSGTEAAPADGSVTPAMREFDDQELVTKAIKINWKSDDKNLIAKQPRAKLGEDNDDEGFDGDFGSFFCYFTEDEDPFAVGVVLQSEVLADAIDYFVGRGDNTEGPEFESGDEEDELDDDDEDDEDEGSIDLEDEEKQPSKKKPKRA